MISFRGTRSFKNWETNIGIWPSHVLATHEDRKLRVHSGFYAFAYLKDEGLVAKVTDLQQCLPEVPAYITGHSLGGALAEIASGEIGGYTLAACYSFGTPWVGNACSTGG